MSLPTLSITASAVCLSVVLGLQPPARAPLEPSKLCPIIAAGAALVSCSVGDVFRCSACLDESTGSHWLQNQADGLYLTRLWLVGNYAQHRVRSASCQTSACTPWFEAFCSHLS